MVGGLNCSCFSRDRSDERRDTCPIRTFFLALCSLCTTSLLIQLGFLSLRLFQDANWAHVCQSSDISCSFPTIFFCEDANLDLLVLVLCFLQILGNIAIELV